MNIEKHKFGMIEEGLPADLYKLTNNEGVSMSVINYGGIITEIDVPDRNGIMGNIVLGFDDIKSYKADNPYFGAIVGRYGNRISEGKFSINGNEYELSTNEGPNHLHGGIKGFDKVTWDIEKFQKESELGLVLTYRSKDGEEGYPGNLDITVQYTLTDKNELKIDYKAITDKPTICNLTNHSYFNLKDAGASSILDHKLQIFADRYLPINNKFLPLGEIADVENTPFDFRKPKRIGDDINAENDQLKNGLGYDHNFIINGENGALKVVARVTEESSGRMLEVYSKEPGVQFYSGNFLDGKLKYNDEIIFEHRNGFCLETQHFPDSPNNPDWPSTLLIPGSTYSSTTIYKFGIEK